MKYHYTSIWTDIVTNSDITKCWWGCEETGSLIHYWWECKMVNPIWKTVWQFLNKLNIAVTIPPSNCTVRHLSQRNENYVHTKIHTQMLIAILFIMTKSWKQSKGPSTDEQLSKMWYILTLEYYSAIKRNEGLIHDIMWWTLKTLC